MIDQAVRQTTAAAYPPVWHYLYPGIYESAYAAAPCEGCGMKCPAVTYRHRWCCASCAKDVLAGVMTSTDLNIPKIISQSHAGGMCPLKHIWRDGPRMSVSAKRGG